MYSVFSNSNKDTRRAAARAVSACLVGALAFSQLLLPLSALADASTTPPVGGQDATTTVTTGGATSVSETQTTANTNFTDTGITGSSSNDASTTENSLEEDPLPPSDAGSTTVSVSNDNEATVETDSTTTAETGGNTASGGNTTVTTGDAVAASTVVNVVNTNVTDSETLLLFLDNLLGGVGDIDLRNALAGFNLSQSTNPCPSCGGSTTTLVSNDNNATVSNNVVVRASTGGNAASSTGDASVSTGNAYAEGNVVNVANTNITDAGYLLMVFNNFGSWDSDLVLPGAELFAKLFGGRGGGSAATNVSNDNSADISNAVDTGADTGGNAATGTDSASVTTGNAVAMSNVVNNINENVLNSGSFKLLIRVQGNWSGDIFGLPKGLVWKQTPAGIVIMSDDGSGSGSSPCCSSATEGVSNVNQALINNNVSVYALTGENEVNGDNASVSTGDAAAVSNVVNVVNTNVIGRNWLLAIVNVTGDWNGNIEFGKPDLWVGARAESSGRVGPGSAVTYEFTIANRGDADATDVRIEHLFRDRTLMQLRSGPGSEFGPGDTIADVGTIKAGEVKSFSFTYRAVNELPFGNHDLPSTVTVTEHEPDANSSDNSDQITVTSLRDAPQPLGGVYVPLDPDPIVTVTKSNDIPSNGGIFSSSTVNYLVDIKNTGGPAYHAFLEDTLVDEWGNVVSHNTWDLGTVMREEIRVAYTTFFSASTSPGTYTNYAQVHAISRNPTINPFYGYFYDSNVATSSVVVIGPKDGSGSVPITSPPPTVIASSTTTVGGTTSGGGSGAQSNALNEPKPLVTPAPGNGQHGPFNLAHAEGKLPVALFDGTVTGDTSLSSSEFHTGQFAAAAASGQHLKDFNFLMFFSLLFLGYVTQRSPKYRAILRSFFTF